MCVCVCVCKRERARACVHLCLCAAVLVFLMCLQVHTHTKFRALSTKGRYPGRVWPRECTRGMYESRATPAAPNHKAVLPGQADSSMLGHN